LTETPTATNTLTPTVTATATATNTLTPTNTPVPGSFPATGLVDNFNRANGAPGPTWGGSTSGYSIVSNRLVAGSGGELFWSPVAYSADQEVYVTLATINTAADEIDLVLKSQSNTTFSSGLIEVLYSPVHQTVQVWTYDSTQNWTKRGDDITVIFANG